MKKKYGKNEKKKKKTGKLRNSEEMSYLAHPGEGIWLRCNCLYQTREESMVLYVTNNGSISFLEKYYVKNYRWFFTEPCKVSI